MDDNRFEKSFRSLIKNLMEIMKLDNYDGEKLIYSLEHQTSQILYFYKNIAAGKDPDKCLYKRCNQNLEHKLVYINIGRGFPKELKDGHWCYVVRDMGTKLLVVPATSIKKDSIFNENFHLEISSGDNSGDFNSRLSLSDLRTVDVQRIDMRKRIKDVITDRNLIMNCIKEKIFDDPTPAKIKEEQEKQEKQVDELVSRLVRLTSPSTGNAVLNNMVNQAEEIGNRRYGIQDNNHNKSNKNINARNNSNKKIDRKGR